MSLDLLWTDKCLLSLMILGLFISLFSLRKKHIRDSFLYIIHKPVAVSAGIVLMLFVLVGVLDSIHFKTASSGSENASSLLDRILYPVGTLYEKTFSAPLALTMFVSETVLEEGVTRQIFPRLKYPPASIQSTQERDKIVKLLFYKAVAYGLGIWICLYILRLCIRGMQKKPLMAPMSGSEQSAFATISFLCMALLFVYGLSRHFHVFGTGQIGEDIFYYTVKSIRTGLVIGTLTTLFMLPLALFFGIISGYFGGVIDDLIQYVYTTLSSIPGILLITASVLSLQTYIASHPDQFNTLAKSADARLLALCLILGVTSWTSLCRLLRAEAMKLREIDYVLAARALGSSWFTIMRKHLLPNVMHIVIITIVLDFSFLVMAEAVLSYVGVGVSPMTISWGNMINGARLELARDPIVWWPIGAAFILMFFLVLAVNLFADAVRDAFDPHRV